MPRPVSHSTSLRLLSSSQSSRPQAEGDTAVRVDLRRENRLCWQQQRGRAGQQQQAHF